MKQNYLVLLLLIASLNVVSSILSDGSNYNSPHDKILAEAEASKSTKSSEDSNPIFDFIFGVVLICISFPLLWNNERK